MHIKLNQILNLVHKHSVDSLVAAACYKVQLFVREQSCCPPPTHGAGKASQPRVWASFVKQRPPLLHKNGWKREDQTKNLFGKIRRPAWKLQWKSWQLLWRSRDSETPFYQSLHFYQSFSANIGPTPVCGGVVACGDSAKCAFWLLCNFAPCRTRTGGGNEGWQEITKPQTFNEHFLFEQNTPLKRFPLVVLYSGHWMERISVHLITMSCPSHSWRGILQDMEWV